MAERETGRVKWFNDAKGYGFIERPQGGEVFVHFSSVRGSGFKKLAGGQRVDYVVTQGEKGPQAQDVGPAADEIQQRDEEIGATGAAAAVADSANVSKPGEDGGEVAEALNASVARAEPRESCKELASGGPTDEEGSEGMKTKNVSEVEMESPEVVDVPSASEEAMGVVETDSV